MMFTGTVVRLHGRDDVPLTVCADGNLKLSHNQRAGTSQASREPLNRLYFGAANDEVQQMARGGDLSLKGFFKLNAPPPAAQQDEAEEESGDAPQEAGSLGAAVVSALLPPQHKPCDTNFVASKTGGNKSDYKDVNGVIGGVCVHGIPLRGGFIDMKTPEQHTYYLTLFKSVLSRRHVHDFYVDFGCQLGRSFFRWLSYARPELEGQVRMLVPWFHASDHKMSCQLQNSAKYTEGTGRVIGEQCEGLWAQMAVRWASPPGSRVFLSFLPALDDATAFSQALKAFTRYAALANRSDCLSAGLAAVAADKLQVLPKLLQKRWDADSKVIEAGDRSRQQVLDDAAKAGFSADAVRAAVPGAVRAAADGPITTQPNDDEWKVRFVCG